jgi:hypothetical protein
MSNCWDGMSREMKRQWTMRAFENACVMAKTVPAFRLRLTLDGRFWEEVEKALTTDRSQRSEVSSSVITRHG